MDVVGHHAPRVDGHAGRCGVASEDVDGGGGDGRTGEDWRAAFHGDGDRADYADVGIDLRREPDASPLWILSGHDPFNGLATAGGGQAPALHPPWFLEAAEPALRAQHRAPEGEI